MTAGPGQPIWTEQADTANAKDMAVLSLVIAPDPRLKAKCDPVKRVDADISRLLDDLLETMKEENGIEPGAGGDRHNRVCHRFGVVRAGHGLGRDAGAADGVRAGGQGPPGP